MIKKELNFTGKINWDKSKPDGTPRKLLNIKRIEKLGWQPRIKLKEGIRKTIKEFEEKYNANQLRIN